MPATRRRTAATALVVEPIGAGGRYTPSPHALMLVKLARSGLAGGDATTLSFKALSAEAIGRLNLPVAAAGFVIPYFNLDGQLTKFYRVRFLEDTRGGFAKLTAAKPLRYAQPRDSVNEVYAPPYVDWRAIAADPTTPILITEGELKAASATRLGMPALGLGGVWMFQSARAGKSWLSPLDQFAWEKRTVYIVFDSDACSNPDVLRAEGALSDRLLGLGAHPRVGRLPPGPEGAKVGLDDYIVEHGGESLRTEVLDCAYEYGAASVLHTLNARVLYVRDPGLIWDRSRAQRLTPSAFVDHAFSNVHYWENRIAKDGTVTRVKTPAASAWLRWEHRAECHGLEFAPGEGEVTEDKRLNTWTGWGVEAPRRGSVAPWAGLLGHLFGTDAAARQYFEQWCAYPLQHPGAKMATAVLIWGVVHGSGKTLIGHTLMRLYGRHSAEIHDTDLDNLRNEWAEGKQFVLADDIVAKGDRVLMRRLMTMITQKTVRLDPKYIPSYAVPDRINYYFTSNDPDAFYLDDGDRRFFIHETQAPKFDVVQRRQFVDWRDSDEGIAALWDHLLRVDLTGFDPQSEAPMTIGKQLMTGLGKSDLGSWVRELRISTQYVLDRAGFTSDLATATELLGMYDPGGTKKVTANALGREMVRSGFIHPAKGTPLKLRSGRVVSVYILRNQDKWTKAAWKACCDHYDATRPPEPARAPKKF